MATFDDLKAQKQDFFKKQREQVSQDANRMQQEAGDAMTRRFAALGAQGSGAAMGAQLKVRDMAEAQKQKALEGVAAQELQTSMADQEAEAQRGFTQKEAEAQRAFAQKEAESQRGFQREMADKDFGFKKEMFDFEKGTKLSELDMAKKQFDLDAETTEFNKRLQLAIQGIQKFDKPINDLVPSAFEAQSQNSGSIQAPLGSGARAASAPASAPSIFTSAGGTRVNLDAIAKDRFGNAFNDLPPASQDLIKQAATLYSNYWANKDRQGRGFKPSAQQIEQARKYIA